VVSTIKKNSPFVLSLSPLPGHHLLPPHLFFLSLSLFSVQFKQPPSQQQHQNNQLGSQHTVNLNPASPNDLLSRIALINHTSSRPHPSSSAMIDHHGPRRASPPHLSAPINVRTHVPKPTPQSPALPPRHRRCKSHPSPAGPI
jgi:hypothetical protein